MCIGPTITHTLIRARPVSEGSMSVHSKNTPVEAKLLNELYERLVIPYWGRLEQIAAAVNEAMGPGFYSHDIMLDTSTDELFMAETGFKFDDKTYCTRFAGIHDDLLFLKGFETPKAVAKQSVAPFIDLIEAHI